MDKRFSYKIVIDTETAPLDRTETKVSPSNMLVYDIGWAVVDKYGKVYKTNSFVVSEVFNQEKDIMNSAYYNNKLPQYHKDIQDGKRVVSSLYSIRQELLKDISEFNVLEIYAHNMFFDYGSLNNTIRWITKSKCRYFFPQTVAICDTLKMAQDILSKKKSYLYFCKTHNYVTKHKTPRPQYKAEVIYKYLTSDLDFIESHTGLEDVMIEKEILAYCYRQHKKMRKELWC